MLVRTPVRTSHTYTQSIAAPPDVVFPLLCPVREVDWVPGWMPRLVVSASGVAELDCVFTTAEGDREATWVITGHDAAAGAMEMLKVVPGYLVTRLRIQVDAAAPGHSRVEVTYSWTALGVEGESYVAGRTPEAYAEFMRGWEGAMNEWLAGREPRPSAPGAG